jgi:hypothetical protein
VLEDKLDEIFRTQKLILWKLLCFIEK